MNREALLAQWREEAARGMTGWDFSHLEGRVVLQVHALFADLDDFDLDRVADPGLSQCLHGFLPPSVELHTIYCKKSDHDYSFFSISQRTYFFKQGVEHAPDAFKKTAYDRISKEYRKQKTESQKRYDIQLAVRVYQCEKACVLQNIPLWTINEIYREGIFS